MKTLSNIFKSIQRFFYPSIEQLPEPCKMVVQEAVKEPVAEIPSPEVKKAPKKRRHYSKKKKPDVL